MQQITEPQIQVSFHVGRSPRGLLARSEVAPEVRRVWFATRTRALLILCSAFAVMLAMMGYVLFQEWHGRLADARERVMRVAEQLALDQQQIVTQTDGVLTLLSRSPTVGRFNFPAECPEFQSEGRKLWPGIANLAVARTDGTIVCDTNVSDRVMNVSARPHFQKALTTSDLVIGNVVTNPLTGKQGLPFNKAVVDETGHTVGEVMTLLDLTWLSKELARSKLPEGSRLALVDSRGIFVARHPDPEGLLGKSIAGNVLSTPAPGEERGTTQAVGMDGVERIWAFAPFAQTLAGPIKLVIGIPTQEVTAGVKNQIRVSGVVALVLLALMFCIVWVGTSRWFLRPVVALVTAARRLAQGDLRARAGIDGVQGELGELGRTFDAMAESVETRELALADSRKSLLRANRALRTLSACNHELVHAASEAELLDSICRIVIEKGGYLMAWVGFAEHDAAKNIRTVAAAGDHGYLETINITWADAEEGRGPVGTAISTGTTHVVNDLRSSPTMALWRAAALEHGSRSTIALPLRDSTGAFGALAIYAAEPNAFDKSEILLLEELAEDLAFGIGALRTKAERDRLSYENHHHEEILRLSLEGTIAVVAATAERRDPYTAGHQKRVSFLATAIAKEMGLTEEQFDGLRIASTVHDLGKIQVPAEILAKPTKLTELEYEMLKLHPEAGYDILKEVQFPWPIADIVRQHHERLDGSGYPHRLSGNKILLEARILAVADVVEAMASHRPYRPALGIDAALSEIERGKGTLFDAAAVNACVTLFRQSRFTLPP